MGAEMPSGAGGTKTGASWITGVLLWLFMRTNPCGEGGPVAETETDGHL